MEKQLSDLIDEELKELDSDFEASKKETDQYKKEVIRSASTDKEEILKPSNKKVRSPLSFFMYRLRKSLKSAFKH